MERILAMAFRVAVYAPPEMDNTDLTKMCKHSAEIKRRLVFITADAIPESYDATVEVKEEGVDG